MLSNPLHRFSPYHNLPSANSALMSNGHVSQAQMHSNSLDSLGQGTHYGVQQLQHAGVSSPHLSRNDAQLKHRQSLYGPSGRASSASGPVRRRISRACDQCNQLRTKCDGQHPCAHCIEFGLGCEYIRERKKRGKASRKDLAQQAAAAASANQSGQTSDSNTGSNRTDSRTDPSQGKGSSHRSQDLPQGGNDNSTMNDLGGETLQQDSTNEAIESLDGMAGPAHLAANNHQATMERDAHHENSQSALDLNTYANGTNTYDRAGLDGHMMSGQNYAHDQGGFSNYPDLPYNLQTQSPSNYNNVGSFRMNPSSLAAYGIGPGTTSPRWGVGIPSPPGQFHTQVPQPSFNHTQLRYPVLEPLVPHLGTILPVSLACDLIDLYFASSSSAQMHPMSPYVLGFVFRKRAFLHPTKPRQCQPALLASMLWVAAQTSDAPFLTSVPSARSKVCQKLLELTVGLLKPLIHTPSGEASPAASPAADGVALGGLGVALPGTISMDALTGEFGAFGAAGSLDDVATYIHLATVVSASEYKGASIRWWNAAWSLARELKLGRELPSSAPPMDHDRSEMDDGLDEHDRYRNSTGFATEEEREERRRIWWLVYIVDRHLALCYNRPLFLLDIECDGLQQPMDDTSWQRGDFGSTASNTTDPNVLDSLQDVSGAAGDMVRGPPFECRGHSIFGYFLPLMAILGEIVDLHHARNHPRFGVGFRSAREWDEQAAEITRHLEGYEQSLKRFEQQHLPKPSEDKMDSGHGDNMDHATGSAEIGTPSVHSVHTNTSNRMTESDIQTRIVIAYGTHVMHVLYILLAGKWDPINLIDDEDLWISSQGFITATSHAVSAAEAISQILEFDPGLEFMPFFFGIYLLQGSFLLLLIADKLQFEASPSVVRACETIVRAHEACVVTLSTEYQRNFSKVMRSALAQVRGRVPEDLNEQHQRRRELLALYRWTGDGTGLAL